MSEEDLVFFNRVRNESRKFLHDSREYSLDDNKAWFCKLETPFLIAEVYGNPVGYFRTSNLSDDSIYIGMDIAEEFRGLGLAQAFYPMAFEELACSFGIKRFYLEVLESNSRAIHIYKKLGFKEVLRYSEKNNVSIKMVMDYDKK